LDRHRRWIRPTGRNRPERPVRRVVPIPFEPSLPPLGGVLSSPARAAYQKTDDQRAICVHHVVGQDSPPPVIRRFEAAFEGGAQFDQRFRNEFPLLSSGLYECVGKIARLNEKGVLHNRRSDSVVIERHRPVNITSMVLKSSTTDAVIDVRDRACS